MRMPVRWMAPEVLKEAAFARPSDVYAFGLLIWEVFSGGSEPWSAYNLLELVTAQRTADGPTLPIDEHIPPKVIVRCPCPLHV